MSGYYFVLIRYTATRFGYSPGKYETPEQAERRRRDLLKKPGVLSARVCYQPTLDEVDVKQFI